MNKTILVLFFILILTTVIGCQTQKEETILAGDVDVVPDIDISQCLSQIKQTNPEMTDQEAKDNCYTIEAVNKVDKSICNKVSEEMRTNCLRLFK
jgi:hypothetical protein